MEFFSSPKLVIYFFIGLLVLIGVLQSFQYLNVTVESVKFITQLSAILAGFSITGFIFMEKENSKVSTSFILPIFLLLSNSLGGIIFLSLIEEIQISAGGPSIMLLYFITAVGSLFFGIMSYLNEKLRNLI